MKNSPLSNIHIINGLIVDGDPSKEAQLTCGLRVTGVTMDNSSNVHLGNVEQTLRSLFHALPKEYSLQVRLSNSGSYYNELEQYHQTSESKGNEWSRSQRNFRYVQCHDYIERGIVSRKEVCMFVSRKLINKDRRHMNDTRIESLLESEARSFDNVIEQVKHSIQQVGGKVERLCDNQLFHEYDKQLNPSMSSYDENKAIHRFKPESDISECCLHGDMSISTKQDCGFYFDGAHHSILVLKSLPSFTSSGMISQLSNLPLRDYSITVLTKPLDLEQEITQEEKNASILKHGLGSSNQARLRMTLQKSNERIDRLASGETAPFQIQMIIHIWDNNLDKLRNHKLTMIKSSILQFQRAQYYLVDNPVMARNYFLSTLPGSPRREKAFAHQTEEVTVCNLLPISGNHDYSLEGAEAIYQTTSNGIFGISLFKNEYGSSYTKHGLITGKTGYGKSAGTIDLLTQLSPHIDITFIIEDGNSYGGYVSTFGELASSFHIDPNGSDTFNYLDTSGLPLSARHRSDVSSILKLMIDKDDRHLVSKSKIGELVYLFYCEHYERWRQKNQSHFQQVCVEFMVAQGFAKSRKHKGLVSNFYTEYVEWKNSSPEKYEKASQHFSEVSADINEADLFQFAFAHMSREEMPTHSQFHDWLIGRNKQGEELLTTSLRSWCRDQGDHGCLFDGVSTVNFTGSIVHVELGKTGDNTQLKALAGFIVSNYIRNTITLMSRSKRKLVVFEELGKFLTIDDADQIIADFYERGRKYNCVVLAVVQQITKIEPQALRNSILGNASFALCFRQEDGENVAALQQAFKLPEATKLEMTNLPTPTKETGSRFICWQAGDSGAMIHSACNIVSPEMLYIVDSSGENYEKRQEALSRYENVLEGVSVEAHR